MNKLADAKLLLKEIGMPEQQYSTIAAYTLLTLANILPNTSWNNATNSWIRIHDVLRFININYGKQYAENTRETIRKQCMHQFREAALVEDNGTATNSPNYRYRITDESLELIKSFQTTNWHNNLTRYRIHHQSLIEKYASKKKMAMMPVKINGKNLFLSPGKHNELQRLIIEKFAPRFAPGCECLYLGDTIKKDLVNNRKKLNDLGFAITLHDKMPDVILYRPDKDWIYFIEAVASVGPMSPQRIIDIQRMTKKVKSGKIFITAFPDMAEYKKFSMTLAWETEVWIADFPDHMIHLNGDKFMGPRS